MPIYWTEPATGDLTKICDYIEGQDGPAAARRVAVRIFEAIDLRSQFPRGGRPGRRRDTRELMITGLPFLAVYRLREDVIEITRILHGAQKWP
jgi:plasmid stabilization system protein ParE